MTGTGSAAYGTRGAEPWKEPAMNERESLTECRIYIGRVHIDVRCSPLSWGWRWGIRRIRENA